MRACFGSCFCFGGGGGDVSCFGSVGINGNGLSRSNEDVADLNRYLNGIRSKIGISRGFALLCLCFYRFSVFVGFRSLVLVGSKVNGEFSGCDYFFVELESAVDCLEYNVEALKRIRNVIVGNVAVVDRYLKGTRDGAVLDINGSNTALTVRT